MKSSRLIIMALIYVGASTLYAAENAIPALKEDEKRAGWVLLFDGVSTNGWRGLGIDGFPADIWDIENHCLHCKAGAKSDDLVTLKQYENFEFSFEWMIPKPKGNSGVKYRVQEQKGKTFAFGPEYQCMNDPGVEDKHATGSLYDLIPPKDKKLAPDGHFNVSKIIVNHNHVEHWLNGVKVVEFAFGSPELEEAITHSKFKNTDWGKKALGYIILQNHHDEAFFRNLKILELPGLK